MAVKILIRRHFKEHAVEQAIDLLNNFRQDAMHQPGYISGETWRNHYDPRTITVVSTWQSVDDCPCLLGFRVSDHKYWSK